MFGRSISVGGYAAGLVATLMVLSNGTVLGNDILRTAFVHLFESLWDDVAEQTGSERSPGFPPRSYCFLSCLSGSEQQNEAQYQAWVFNLRLKEEQLFMHFLCSAEKN